MGHCPYVASNCFLLMKELIKLESNIKSQVSEIDKKIKVASTKTTIFLQDIGQGLLGTKVLIDIAEYWSELNSILLDFEKRQRDNGIVKKSFDWIKRNMPNVKSTEKAIAELSVLREKIGYMIYEHVENASYKLISADSNVTDALKSMTNSQEEIVFLLSYHLLYSQEGSLYEWVLNYRQSEFNEEGNLYNLFAKAQQSLALALQLLTHQAPILLSNGNLSILNELICFLQHHDVFY